MRQNLVRRLFGRIIKNDLYVRRKSHQLDMSDIETLNIFELRQKVQQLSEQLRQEREEHKEMYLKIKTNIEVLEKNSLNSRTDGENCFKIFHLEEENKRLQNENDNLRSMLTSNIIM